MSARNKKRGALPTRQYASGGPRRKPPSRHAPSKQLAVVGECGCDGVLKRICGEPMTSDRRICTRCLGDASGRVSS